VASDRVYVWGRNRSRKPVYHLPGDVGRTACGLEVDAGMFDQQTLMGWAPLNEIRAVASPCGLLPLTMNRRSDDLLQLLARETGEGTNSTYSAAAVIVDAIREMDLVNEIRALRDAVAAPCSHQVGTARPLMDGSWS
jgi:hypothetical protein